MMPEAEVAEADATGRRLDGAEESAVIGGADQEDQEQPALHYEMDAGLGGFADVGQAELNKAELLDTYRQRCAIMQVSPNRCFIRYLEETADENESLELVIQGNDKLNFNSRLNDEGLVAMCSALVPYASYLEDIDLRFNEIGDLGARALGDLLSRANRLLGLNL